MQSLAGNLRPGIDNRGWTCLQYKPEAPASERIEVERKDSKHSFLCPRASAESAVDVFDSEVRKARNAWNRGYRGSARMEEDEESAFSKLVGLTKINSLA